MGHVVLFECYALWFLPLSMILLLSEMESDPTTGFDVLSDDPNPQHSSLKWANGTPSGFAIKNISPAGQVIFADVLVPH